MGALRQIKVSVSSISTERLVPFGKIKSAFLGLISFILKRSYLSALRTDEWDQFIDLANELLLHWELIFRHKCHLKLDFPCGGHTIQIFPSELDLFMRNWCHFQFENLFVSAEARPQQRPLGQVWLVAAKET